MNVYIYVDMNYAQEPELNIILPKDLVVGFLRKKAWTRAGDDELRRTWRDIYAYIYANLQTEQFPFQNNGIYSMGVILGWLNKYALDFPLTAKDIKRFFKNIQELQNYLLETYKEFPGSQESDYQAIYRKLTDAAGELDLSAAAERDSKVLHIDFSSKKVEKPDLSIPTYTQNKQILFVREYLMELPDKVFEITGFPEYNVSSEKYFLSYEGYWSHYIEQVSAKDSFDESPEDCDLRNPGNIIAFIEYLTFGTGDYVANPSILSVLLEKNKDPYLAAFLNNYKNSRLVFFKIVGMSDNEFTIAENIITKEKINMDGIDIMNFGKDEVFLAYFAPTGNILPSMSISVDMSETQIKGFIEAMQIIYRCAVAPGVQTFEEFWRSHELLARYLQIFCVRNGGVIQKLKQLFKPQLLSEPRVSKRSDPAKIKDKIIAIGNILNFTAAEQDKLAGLWNNFNLSRTERGGRIVDLHCFTVVLNEFLQLNYPDEIFDKINLFLSTHCEIFINRNAEKLPRLAGKDYTPYLTEVGWIKLLEQIFDKE